MSVNPVVVEDEMMLTEVPPLTEMQLLEAISGSLIEINWKITAFIVIWLLFKMWGGSRKL